MCRLSQKLYQQQQTLFILTDSEAKAKQLDELLWTFNESVFLPHSLLSNSNLAAPIRLGSDEPNMAFAILLNLKQQPPHQTQAYQRILEIVAPNANDKQQRREHYRYYQQQGYEVHSHQLNT